AIGAIAPTSPTAPTAPAASAASAATSAPIAAPPVHQSEGTRPPPARPRQVDMAEAQLPDSKLMKLAPLPDRLSGCPPELNSGPPRKVERLPICVTRLSLLASAAFAASIVV